MAGETSKAVERTSTAGETRTAVETNPAVGRAGMSLENILLLVIMGSLVLSAVMVATCLMGVTIQLCRKSRTATTAAAASVPREIPTVLFQTLVFPTTISESNFPL